MYEYIIKNGVSQNEFLNLKGKKHEYVLYLRDEYGNCSTDSFLKSRKVDKRKIIVKRTRTSLRVLNPIIPEKRIAGTKKTL